MTDASGRPGRACATRWPSGALSRSRTPRLAAAAADARGRRAARRSTRPRLLRLAPHGRGEGQRLQRLSTCSRSWRAYGPFYAGAARGGSLRQEPVELLAVVSPWLAPTQISVAFREPELHAKVSVLTLDSLPARDLGRAEATTSRSGGCSSRRGIVYARDDAARRCDRRRRSRRRSPRPGAGRARGCPSSFDVDAYGRRALEAVDVVGDPPRAARPGGAPCGRRSACVQMPVVRRPARPRSRSRGDCRDRVAGLLAGEPFRNQPLSGFV